MASGKAIVLPIAILLVVALGVALVYKTTEESRGLMVFEQVPAAANETAYPLPFKPVHAALFLEDHLEQCTLKGRSEETIRLRVDSMQGTLANLTGSNGPTWLVKWQEKTIRITV